MMANQRKQKRAARAKLTPKIKSRIVGEAWEDPRKLVFNPLNPREHPATQSEAMDAMLREVGWVQRVVINRRTGNLLDGELRLMLALDANEPKVPVIYVDISAAEEGKVLALFDHIGSLAAVNPERMEKLIQEAKTKSETLQSVLADLRERLMPALTIGEGESSAHFADNENQRLQDRLDAGDGSTSTLKEARLFLSEKDHGKFMNAVQELAESWELTNITDTVFKAVLYARDQIAGKNKRKRDARKSRKGSRTR